MIRWPESTNIAQTEPIRCCWTFQSVYKKQNDVARRSIK